ncbi:MAG: FUSC family protein [Pseudoxanthomonas sp.]
MRRGPPGRWRFALRAAACMGVPVLVGGLSGHTAAGLMAATGGFTAVYGSGRPYLSRARELALIALAFATVTGFGLAVAPLGWAVVVPAVALLAMLATWFCNALQVGPPGGYLFLMACAASASMLKPPFDPWHASLLVLAGGAFAWAVHMAGALAWPRGPEKAAVAQAARAVLAFLDASGTPLRATARHEAALALHQAWSALVTYQPVAARPGGRLATLRALNRQLHLVFARAAGTDGAASPALSDDVRRIEAQALSLPRKRSSDAPAVPPGVPVGHPGAWHALKGALIEPASRQVILRVGVASLLAGGLGALFHLERAYWAVAAAVLMLHQGFDWTRTVVRALERLLGTWVGLLLAGAILLWHPQGLWLVLTIMLLQFVVEMLVVRHYALAVVFITGAALTLASGGHPVDAPGEYLLARGLDTLVGCAVALLVYRALPVRDDGRGLSAPMARVLHGVATLAPMLASGQVDDVAARTARRDLQRTTFALEQAYGAAVVASPRQRAVAEDRWPLVAAVQQLAYRMLSACWQRSHGEDAAVRAFDAADAMALQQSLSMFERKLSGEALEDGVDASAPLFGSELQAVRACLTERPPQGPL